jgi:hypothetical protein
MTEKNKQMYDDFQLVYNNLASNLAPGLDVYEISMYLTKAYFSLVEEAYYNYEQSEFFRKFLIGLVKSKKIPSSNSDIEKIASGSIFFKIPEDVLYVLYESLEMSDKANKCIQGKSIKIVPVTHDDFHNTYENPFKFNLTKALRLDVSNGDNYAEIVSKDPSVKSYNIRYIKKPLPIILETLTGEDKIEGIQEETECELNSTVFPKIVQLAAKMAYQNYKTI